MTNKHPERDRDHILYALQCIARIEQLITVGKVALFDNADMIDPLCWNMYQLADVIGKVSDVVQARHPEVPWRAIAGLRNFYAHAYEGIDMERMWADLQEVILTSLRGSLTTLTVNLVRCLMHATHTFDTTHSECTAYGICVEQPPLFTPVPSRCFTISDC
jgi:uncharacterized protein with HEPN domain